MLLIIVKVTLFFSLQHFNQYFYFVSIIFSFIANFAKNKKENGKSYVFLYITLEMFKKYDFENNSKELLFFNENFLFSVKHRSIKFESLARKFAHCINLVLSSSLLPQSAL